MDKAKVNARGNVECTCGNTADMAENELSFEQNDDGTLTCGACGSQLEAPDDPS